MSVNINPRFLKFVRIKTRYYIPSSLKTIIPQTERITK